MSFKKIFLGALLCNAMAVAHADYLDLAWRMDGSTVRDSVSSVESQNALSELALFSWDIGVSATRDIYRYPFKAIFFTIR